MAIGRDLPTGLRFHAPDRAVLLMSDIAGKRDQIAADEVTRNIQTIQEQDTDLSRLFSKILSSRVSVVQPNRAFGFIQTQEPVISAVEVRVDPSKGTATEFIRDLNRFLMQLGRDVIGLASETNLQFAYHNWHIRGNSDPAHIPGGGPGSEPWPTLAINYGEIVPPQAINPDYHIFILDTLPSVSNSDINPGFYEWWDEDVDRITMLESLSAGNRGPKEIDEALRYFFMEARPVEPATSPLNYELPNHGLFIASLIRKFAPSAKYTVIETMNRYNIGTILCFQAVIEKLRAEIANSSAKRILINMSFSYDIPAKDYDLEAILRASAVDEILDPDEIDRLVELHEQSGTKEYLAGEQWEQFLGTQQALLDLLREDERVNVVAAVGNDSSSTRKFPPRYPARFKGIHGVAAKDSDYSNLEDEDNEGFNARGGLRQPRRDLFDSALYYKPKENVADHLIVGVYPNGVFRESLPVPTGYATWAGTSFATARVTGMLANELMTNGNDMDNAINAVKLLD